MSRPSSTAAAAGIAPLIASTVLLAVKIIWPDIYDQIPPEYQGYLISGIAFWFAWKQKENTYKMVDPTKYSVIPKGEGHGQAGTER